MVDNYMYDKSYPVIIKVINRDDFDRINERSKFSWN